MKKVFRSICSGILAGMLLLGNMAFATSGQIERLTPDSPDYAELIALTDRVLDDINSLQEYDDSGIDSDATASDIDWGQAYKIYVDESDVYASYAEQTMTYDQIQQSMDYYVWMLPVKVDDAHLSITISKGLPLAEDDAARQVLTEEQIQQVEADAGKWCPVEIEELDYDKTAEWYEQKLTDAYDGDVQRAFIMGGSPKMRSAVCVLESADSRVQVALVEEPRLTGQLPATRSSIEQPENGITYSMEDMANMMQPYVLNPDSEQTGTGGTGTTADTTQTDEDFYVVAAILCAAIFVMLGIGMKRRT